MKALIAGCGDLGMRTAALLCQAGHEVIGLRRRPALQSDGDTVTGESINHPVSPGSLLTCVTPPA